MIHTSYAAALARELAEAIEQRDNLRPEGCYPVGSTSREIEDFKRRAANGHIAQLIAKLSQETATQTA